MVMLRPASEMKDSGIEWVGQIPSNWRVVKNNRLFRITKTLVDDAWETTQLLSLTKGGIIEKNINDGGGKQPESFSTYQFVEKDDIVLCLFDIDVSAVFSDRSSFDGMISPAYRVMKCEKNILPVYAKWWFDAVNVGRYYLIYTKSLRKTIDSEGFGNILTAIPPLSEQQAIADYLDDRCSKIDEIIAEATASIEEYKELKQAVIFEAVTKGLDKNVPMKDSGVHWIGDIPASWTYFKLRYVVDDIGDIDHYMPEPVMSGIPYVMTGDLKDVASEIDFDSCKQVSYEDYIKLSKKISVNKGDVIFARYASIGVICYVDIDKDFLVSYSCVTIKPKHDLINGWFLKYYLQSSAFKEEVMRYANSNVQANVGKESMYQAKIALPSMDEQKEIVNYLDIKVGDIESLISEKRALIDDLQMYKKSLIYEVVTGKRRVSDVN